MRLQCYAGWHVDFVITEINTEPPCYIIEYERHGEWGKSPCINECSSVVLVEMQNLS